MYLVETPIDGLEIVNSKQAVLDMIDYCIKQGYRLTDCSAKEVKIIKNLKFTVCTQETTIKENKVKITK